MPSRCLWSRNPSSCRKRPPLAESVWLADRSVALVIAGLYAGGPNVALSAVVFVVTATALAFVLARLRLAIELWFAHPSADMHAEIVRNLAESDQLVEEILLASRLEPKIL